MSLILAAIYSLLAAFLKAGKSITTKFAVEDTNEYIVVWGFRLTTALLALPIILITDTPAIPTEPSFWIAVAANSIILSITSVLIAKAYKQSDISVISPLLAFVPLTVAIPAWILLNEQPTILAAIGIFLISLGAYTLQIHTTETSYLDPIRSLTKNTGARYIGLTLILVSVVPSIDKIGLTNTTPLIWMFGLHLGMAICLTPFAIKEYINTETHTQPPTKTVGILITLGALNAGIWIAQLYGYELTQVAYVQAIKRFSIILAIIAGWAFFDEQHIKQRLIGGTIILIGVILIIVGG